MDLSGETAIVTGASRGMGRAIASALHERGANVALWSRREQAVAAAAQHMTNGEGATLARAVDVRDCGQVQEAVTEVRAELGPVTLLVNNAGTAGPAAMEWVADPDDWWQCVETSVRGSFHCARAVLPDMLEHGTGRIVEMVSTTGTRAFPLLGATSVAKAAMIRHTENLAAATADTDVSVFALVPGIVDTDLLASYRSNPEMAAFFDGLAPEMYTPEAVVAEAVARLATGAFDDLSGCVLDVTSDLDALVADGAVRSPDHLKLRLMS